MLNLVRFLRTTILNLKQGRQKRFVETVTFSYQGNRVLNLSWKKSILEITVSLSIGNAKSISEFYNLSKINIFEIIVSHQIKLLVLNLFEIFYQKAITVRIVSTKCFVCFSRIFISLVFLQPFGTTRYCHQQSKLASFTWRMRKRYLTSVLFFSCMTGIFKNGSFRSC